MLLSATLLLLACDPWGPEKRGEQAWYDADLLEEERGLTLVPLAGGEPLQRHGNRVIVYADRIGVSNRAWVLDHFTRPEMEGRDVPTSLARELIVDEDAVVPLVEGRVEPAHRRGHLIMPLYEVLLEMVEAEKSASGRVGAAEPWFDGSLQVYLDESIPADTLHTVLYTAGQAQLGEWMLMGRVGSHPRFVLSAEHDCRTNVHAELTDVGVRLRCSSGEALIIDGSCAWSTADIHAAIDALYDACTPHWTTPAPPSRRGEQPRDCVGVMPAMIGSAPASRYLALFGEGYGHAPRAQWRLPTWLPSSEACAPSLELTAETAAQLCRGERWRRSPSPEPLESPPTR